MHEIETPCRAEAWRRRMIQMDEATRKKIDALRGGIMKSLVAPESRVAGRSGKRDESEKATVKMLDKH